MFDGRSTGDSRCFEHRANARTDHYYRIFAIDCIYFVNYVLQQYVQDTDSLTYRTIKDPYYGQSKVQRENLAT